MEISLSGLVLLWSGMATALISEIPGSGEMGADVSQLWGSRRKALNSNYMKKLDEVTLNAIYDILVQTCGAQDDGVSRKQFVGCVIGRDPMDSCACSFIGSLGSGGQVWFYSADVPFVNYYKEDSTPERRRAMAQANKQLKDLIAKGME